jgi:hypothetical protein
MYKRYATMLIVCGVILALSQVVGIPFSWRQTVGGLIGVVLIGWGLYALYGNNHETRTE